MPANAMVAPPGVDGRIFYDESVQGFNFRRERVPLAVALKTLLKYQHDDSPPTIYIGSTTIDTYLPGLRTENDLDLGDRDPLRSEEHTSELQSLMRISYAVFCLKKKKHTTNT